MEVFAVGSVVRLKIGGPKIIIESILDGKAVCVWAVEETIRQKSLDLETLQSELPELSDTELANSIAEGFLKWLAEEPRQDSSAQGIRQLEEPLTSGLKRIQARLAHDKNDHVQVVS
jgi:uncharacterized protein YodC (DUF2158 family)